MKKYCIFATVIGVICFISGIVITCFSASTGLYNDFYNIVSDNNVTAETEPIVTEILDEFYPTDTAPTETHRHDLSASDSAKIKKIDIEASNAKVNFYSSYNDCIQISTSGNGSKLVNIDFSSDSIDIDYGSSGVDFTDLGAIDLKSIGNIADSVPEIDIYLPETKELEEVSIELASGEVSLYYLQTVNLDIELAAGEINIHNSKISEKPDIDLVAGNIHISSCYTNNLDIETVSGGDIYISECELLGDTQIDAVSGNTDMYYLIGDIDDYDFDIEVITGNVRINGDSIIPDNDGAPNRISISKVSGDCFIEFN